MARRRRKNLRKAQETMGDQHPPGEQGDLLSETIPPSEGRKGEAGEESMAPGREGGGEEEAMAGLQAVAASRSGAKEGATDEGKEPMEMEPGADSVVRPGAEDAPVQDPGSGAADSHLLQEGASAEAPAQEEVQPIPESPWEQKMAWAKERVREGRHEDALELYRELVGEDPSSMRALNNMGILLDMMGRHEEAVGCLRKAHEQDPQNLEVAGNLGAALGALGKYAEADEQLRRVLRKDPGNFEVRANLGILFFRRGLYEQAEEELAAVCRARPDHGTAFYYRGEALNRLGRVEEAIDALTESLELSPRNPRAYYTLGILFDKKNLPELAEGMYRKSRELSGR